MPRLRCLARITLLLLLAVTLVGAPPALATTPSTQTTSFPVQRALDWLGSLLPIDRVTAGSDGFPNQDPNGTTTPTPVPSGDGAETYSADPPEGEGFPNQDPDG